jgi:hypothetical protein
MRAYLYIPLSIYIGGGAAAARDQQPQLRHLLLLLYYVCPHTCISLYLSLYIGGGAAAARDKPQLRHLLPAWRLRLGRRNLRYTSSCCWCVYYFTTSTVVK